MLTSDSLHDAVASVRRAASVEDDAVAALLRAADALTASAVTMLSRRSVMSGGGLPCDMALSLRARLPWSDSRAFVRASATLSSMPLLAEAFERGDVSWGQVRQICAAVKVCSASQRVEIDEVIGRALPGLVHQDPDELVGLVDDEVARIRADLTRAREDRAVEASFLVIQPSLDGRATIFGEGDVVSVATIAEAASAAAPLPSETPSRAQGLFDGLLAVSEAYLAGDRAGAADPTRAREDGSRGPALPALPARTRPRPRILVTADLDDLVQAAEGHGARLLWSLAGRPARVTPLTTEILTCDADLVPVIFDGGQPVAIGDPHRTVPGKVRRALIARDQGCRFPGCRAPVAWTDAHHVRYRSNGGSTEPGNLVLLCRRCHRRVHRYGWVISMREDGSIAFTWRGRTLVSPARAGPSCRR